MKPLKYWTPHTFEISSYKWHLSEKVNKSYRYSGSDDTGKCTYTYNELGFRGDSIHKEGFKVMSLGCSHTEGVGVNNDETWPAQFTKLIPNGVNHNFGMGGRSNDYISRCLLTYYDIIKPDLVLIMYTSPQRREIYTKENEIEPFMPTHSWGYLSETEDGKKIQSLKLELQNDNEDFINWYKNHLLIKYFLESKKCNWIWNGSFLNTEYLDNFRFDGNYLNFIDFGVDGGHSGPKNNHQYSIKLSEHINDKFRNYLPKEFYPSEGINKITEKLI
jgi:hypothetical protein